MPAVQRFVMVVEPAERAVWGERAAKAGVTTAEFVRRAAAAYDPEEAAEMEMLRALLPDLREAATDMRESLAEAQRALAEALDPERDAEAKRRAEASITDAEVEAMAELLA